MKATSKNRLRLHRETLRELQSAALSRVRGGDSGSLSCTGTDCRPTFDGCYSTGCEPSNIRQD